MFFRHPSARLPSLNDWPRVFPELVENRQFLGKAQRGALPATSRLLRKDIGDVGVLRRFAQGRNLFKKIAFSSLGAIALPQNQLTRIERVSPAGARKGAAPPASSIFEEASEDP